MLTFIGNASLVIFFAILVDVLTLGVSTRWARSGAAGVAGFVRRGMRRG